MIGIDQAVIGFVRLVNCGKRLACAFQSKVPPSTTMPPMAEPWPPRNLVSECTTISAPYSIGRSQDGRRHRVVHDQRHAMVVGDLGDGFDVADIAGGIADGFAEQGAGIFVDQASPSRRRWPLSANRPVDARARQQMRQQRVGGAVKLGRGDDIAAAVGDIGQGIDTAPPGRRRPRSPRRRLPARRRAFPVPRRWDC